MSLTQLKIGTRLGIGFAVVLGLLVAVLLVGLYSMAQLSERTHDIVADKNVKMAAANTMSDNVRNITLAITSVVVAPTEALVQTELAKIGEARKKYGAAKETLQKKISTDKETALMAELDLPHGRVNVHGGACALGHPIGASGARIVVTLVHALQAHGLRRGVATLCIGGGEATAMAVELV